MLVFDKIIGSCLCRRTVHGKEGLVPGNALACLFCDMNVIRIHTVYKYEDMQRNNPHATMPPLPVSIVSCCALVRSYGKLRGALTTSRRLTCSPYISNQRKRDKVNSSVLAPNTPYTVGDGTLQHNRRHFLSFGHSCSAQPSHICDNWVFYN